MNDGKMPERKDLEHWLLSEARDQDEAAEAAFAHLFAALPKVAAGAGFVERTMAAAWRVRARRRRMVALAWAASMVVAVAGAVLAYTTTPYVGPWAIKTAAFATGHSLPWLISYTTVALDWWWTLGRIGGHVADAIATPARTTALVVVELIGILAFFALHRLAAAEPLGDAHV
jgi:hypothetical protein